MKPVESRAFRKILPVTDSKAVLRHSVQAFQKFKVKWELGLNSSHSLFFFVKYLLVFDVLR